MRQTFLSHRKLGIKLYSVPPINNRIPYRIKDPINYLSKIWQYSVASTDNAAFIIGGKDIIGGNLNAIDIIAKFEDNQWSRYESLKAARYVNGSITSTNQTMIIGGETFS